MTEIVIVDAVRTPLGRRKGWLRETHPVKLGAHAIQAVLKRADLSPDSVDHVIFGCVGQVGEQAFNVARHVALEARIPLEVPATSVDFQCGSSQQAVHLAAAMVTSGQLELVVAGGVESMTRVPMGSSMAGGNPFTDYLMEEYNMIPQGVASDEIAQKWGITREQVDQIGYESHMRAAIATEEGWMKREFAPIEGVDDDGNPVTVDRDQGIRFNTSLEKMATLNPVFTPDGVTTAANSSQISDGAAAIIVTSAEKARELGLKPRARFVAAATVGSDPHLMLTAPPIATKKVLKRAGMTLNDIDVFEVNEAFATVVAMWQQETGVDMAKVNVHGSSIALGHPLGASGARLMTTLLNVLEVHDKQFGLQTMCCGGGLGTGTIIERIQ